MAQYIIYAHDGSDDAAPARRMASRQAHIAAGDKARAAGQMLCALALINDENAMIGSLLVMNFPDRAALDAWLAQEPYVTGNVWQNIQVLNARLGPSFQDLIS